MPSRGKRKAQVSTTRQSGLEHTYTILWEACAMRKLQRMVSLLAHFSEVPIRLAIEQINMLRIFLCECKGKNYYPNNKTFIKKKAKSPTQHGFSPQILPIYIISKNFEFQKL